MIRLTFALAAVLASAPAAAQTLGDAGQVSGPVGAKMDDYMKRAEALGFSGQVLVAKGGTVLLDRAYGFRDRQARLPMTTGTAVGVASMSKQFAAAAILKLESAGRLYLTDTLGVFFAGLPIDKRSITVQQILTHTGGIQGGTTDDFDVATLDQSMARLMSLPLTQVPGTKWQYSSDAYGIIAAIVQRVSGMPYERYMREEIFKPAGMTRTGFWNEGTMMMPVAHAYSGARDRGTPAEWPRNWRVFGSGDVLTTAADLYRWDRALRTGSVMSSAALAEYQTPQVQIEDGPDMYGYGLFFEKSSRGTRVIEHGGDTELGFNGAFFRYVDEDAVLIITSNARDPYGRSLRQYVQGDLEKMLFGNDSIEQFPKLARPSPEQQTSLAGTYRVGNGSEVNLISDGAMLWVAADGQQAVDLFRPPTPAVNPDLLRVADSRTDTLLRSLLARDTAAYARALGDSGIANLGDYRGEWDGLVRMFGPMNGFRILGSVPDRNSVMTYALLSFFRGDRPMIFRWSNLGKGRLVSTNPESPAPYPVMIPLGIDDGGHLVAYDFWRAQPRASIALSGGVLRIQRMEGGKPSGAVVESDTVSRVGWSDR